MESPCEPADCLDRHVGLLVGLPFSGRSHRSKGMDRGSEVVAYKQESIDRFLALTLPEQFEAG